MTINNNLITEYNALHADVEAFRKGLPRQREIVENKIRALSSTMAYSFHSSDYSWLYRAVIQDLAALDYPIAVHLKGQVEKIQYKVELRRMASQPKLLAEWLNINESDFHSNPERVLRAFEARQKSENPPKDFQETFDTEVSRMVVSSLGLDDSTVPQVRSWSLEPALKAMVLGHLINFKETRLDNFDLSFQELKEIAPYLMYVDCRNLHFKDDNEAQEFVQCCSNAYVLSINSDVITELKPSSANLRFIFCGSCNSLEKIILCNLLNLRAVNFVGCESLNESICVNLPLLEKIECSGSLALKAGTFFNLPSLQEFYDLETIELPATPKL